MKNQVDEFTLKCWSLYWVKSRPGSLRKGRRSISWEGSKVILLSTSWVKKSLKALKNW